MLHLHLKKYGMHAKEEEPLAPKDYQGKKKILRDDSLVAHTVSTLL